MPFEVVDCFVGGHLECVGEFREKLFVGEFLAVVDGRHDEGLVPLGELPQHFDLPSSKVMLPPFRFNRRLEILMIVEEIQSHVASQCILDKFLGKG